MTNSGSGGSGGSGGNAAPFYILGYDNFPDDIVRHTADGQSACGAFGVSVCDDGHVFPALVLGPTEYLALVAALAFARDEQRTTLGAALRFVLARGRASGLRVPEYSDVAAEMDARLQGVVDALGRAGIGMAHHLAQVRAGHAGGMAMPAPGAAPDMVS